MDAPTHIETMEELLATMEAEFALHERDVALEGHDIDSRDFEESIVGALDAIGEETASANKADSTGITEAGEGIRVTVGTPEEVDAFLAALDDALRAAGLQG